MDDELTRWREDRLLWWLILLVGIHSCLLGVAMLCAPRWTLQTVGFQEVGPLFFPSQSGVFLLIIGLCYLRALVEPSFVKTILVSKVLAVGFLLVHVVFFSAPPIIWAAAAGDTSMLVAVAALVRRHEIQRRSEARPAE